MEHDEEVLEKFIGLIKWAARRHSYKIGAECKEYEAVGSLVLANCLSKWKEKGRSIDELEFSKYFKTSLFYKFRQMMVAAKSQKRAGTIIKDEEGVEHRILKIVPLEEAVGIHKYDDGFDSILVKNLILRIKDDLNDFEKEVFDCMVDPPEPLNLIAIRENRRKMKCAAITGEKVRGINRVRIGVETIIKYLNINGHGPVTETKFFATKKHIQEVVHRIVVTRRVRRAKTDDE